MNTRAHWRLILGIVAILLAAGVAFTLAASKSAGPRGGGLPRTVTVPVQPVTRYVPAKAGGVVAEVAGREGERVGAGRVLVRFETAGLAEQRRKLDAALRVTRAALESSRQLASLPGGLRAALIEAHPEVTAAEERYVRAVAGLPAGQAAWEQAAGERARVRERLGRTLANAGAGAELAAMIPSLTERLREVDGRLAESEVRAPAEGVIDVLDLHPGDRLPPRNPAVVLLVPGEYFCEFPLPMTDAAALRVGMESSGQLGGSGATVRWRIESLTPRTVPVGLRENRQVAQEMLVRGRFSAGEMRRGTAVVLELPVAGTGR